MSGWWFAAGCVALIVAILLILSLEGNRRGREQARALAGRRASPSHEQFVASLAADCDADIAEFLWEELSPEWADWHAGLTPHPDDDVLKDLPIDDEDPHYWLENYCDSRGLDWKRWRPWDIGQPMTVRNFARWLSEGQSVPVEDAA